MLKKAKEERQIYLPMSCMLSLLRSESSRETAEQRVVRIRQFPCIQEDHGRECCVCVYVCVRARLGRGIKRENKVISLKEKQHREVLKGEADLKTSFANSTVLQRLTMFTITTTLTESLLNNGNCIKYLCWLFNIHKTLSFGKN